MQPDSAPPCLIGFPFVFNPSYTLSHRSYAACCINWNPNIWYRMARLCTTTSPISSSGLFPPDPNPGFDMPSSPIDVNGIVHRLRMQRKDEEDDDVASIMTLSVDEVLGDGEKTGHCLMRMECLSASSGSNYSSYGDVESQCQSPRDARDTFDYPESVGWDSNSETHYSRSETHSSSASVGYVKIALSAEIMSSPDQEKASPPRQVHLDSTHVVFDSRIFISRGYFANCLNTSQIIYHSPTLPNHPDLDSRDASAFDSVMLKRAETLQEVSMVECLSSEELRRDPWNPAVPLLAVVNANEPDDEVAILILERLQPYDAVPCKTVRDVVDLTRQLLQVCECRKYDVEGSRQGI